MALFKIEKKLQPITENPFRLESEMQKLTEENLATIFGLDFVRSEFALHNLRIDTLAFDRETNSFVIIEYKKDKNYSVVDQGLAYLSLMLNNKADFILEFNEQQQQNLARKDVDWSQSRVLFVAPSFTRYQQEALNFKDLPIELWEVTRFSNNTISYHQVKKNNAQESIKTISKTDSSIDQVSKEIKIYSEEEHLQNVSEEIAELYEKLKNAICNFDNIEIKPRKKYIAFVANGNIVDIALLAKGIKIWLNLPKGTLDDPKKLTRDVSNTGHWGNGDYELKITSDEDLEYILSLVKQSVKVHSK